MVCRNWHRMHIAEIRNKGIQMGFIDKIKSIFVVSDDALINSKKAAVNKGKGTMLQIPSEMKSDNIFAVLQAYGRQAGVQMNADVQQSKSNALMSSLKNQAIKMHEEILKCYAKQNQTPDEKMLNKLTVINMFYLAMGSAILAKVKRSNLIAQGVFQKLMKKSGPEFFYREVAAMAGNKYGAEDVEELHEHVQHATILLLTECDKRKEAGTFDIKEHASSVIECAKAMYMYGLSISLKERRDKTQETE